MKLFTKDLLSAERDFMQAYIYFVRKNFKIPTLAVLGDSQKVKGLITFWSCMLVGYIHTYIHFSQPYLYRLVLLHSTVPEHLARPGTG